MSIVLIWESLKDFGFYSQSDGGYEILRQVNVQIRYYQMIFQRVCVPLLMVASFPIMWAYHFTNSHWLTLYCFQFFAHYTRMGSLVTIRLVRMSYLAINTCTLSQTHSYSFWRLQRVGTWSELNLNVNLLHPSIFNIGLTYRNSSCHPGFCHRFTSCASGHTAWKDKQETPRGMGKRGRPLLPWELTLEKAECHSWGGASRT